LKCFDVYIGIHEHLKIWYYNYNYFVARGRWTEVEEEMRENPSLHFVNVDYGQ
jgi:hypothetical protein